MSWQFNITENGTTTLANAGKYCDRNIDVIVDVAGAGGVDIKTAQVTIDCSYVTANTDNPYASTIYVEYATKNQEWAYADVLAGNTLTIETLQGSMLVAWCGSELAYNDSFGVSVSGDVQQCGIDDVYFKVNGDGRLFIWSN